MLGNHESLLSNIFNNKITPNENYPDYGTYLLYVCALGYYTTSLGVELTRSFASVTLLEGNTVTILCTPNVTDVVLFWVYNDNGTNITESTGRIRLSPTGINHELTIINPIMADSGIYFCRTDVEDLIVEQSINVTIVPGTYSYLPKYIFVLNLVWFNLHKATSDMGYCVLHNVESAM